MAENKHEKIEADVRILPGTRSDMENGVAGYGHHASKATSVI